MSLILRLYRKLLENIFDVPLSRGDIISNRYEIKRILGSGSYGMVYECINLQTNQLVAVKQLRQSRRWRKKHVQKFLLEVGILEKLNHRGIPKSNETFIFQKNHYYSMDYMKGQNLEQLLFDKEQLYTEKESLLLIKDILEIVEYLHQHRIYHRDMRIPNIILINGYPVIIDFGLAVQMSVEESYRNLGCRAKKNLEGLEQQLKLNDYYDLGDMLLFLLYSTFPATDKKALPWTEELTLQQGTVKLIKRLLGILEPYNTIKEIKKDLDAAISEVT